MNLIDFYLITTSIASIVIIITFLIFLIVFLILAIKTIKILKNVKKISDNLKELSYKAKNYSEDLMARFEAFRRTFLTLNGVRTILKDIWNNYKNNEE